MTGTELRAAFEAGKASSRVPHAPNPYLPAEPDSERMVLARMWRRGRTAHLEEVFAGF